MTSPQIKSLARRLDRIEREARQRKLPTLGHSSIDGGALQANDDDGALTLIIGQQFDGTNTAAVVTGPKPPQPIDPLVTAQAGALRIFWDGTFVDGATAPMDFARVLAYAIPLASFVEPDPLDHTIIVGQFTSATGGEVTAALDSGVEYAVYLVTWTQAGKFGDPSGVATATAGVIVDQAAIDAVQDAADQAQAAADAADTKAEQAAADATQASSDAAAAQAAASQAASDAAAADSKADQAAADAAAAVGIAEGKGLVLIQSTTPTVDQQADTTLWIDTTNGDNTPKRWDGASWVVVQDAAIQAAADEAAQAASDAAAAQAAASQAASDAAAAQSAADAAQADATQAINDAQAASILAGEKAAIYRSPSMPWTNGDSSHADDAGDMWIDTTLQPGGEITVDSWSASGDLVTLTTSGDHGIAAGKQIAVNGVDPTADGTFTVASAPDTFLLTYSVTIPDQGSTEVSDATVQGLDMVPLNRTHIWDGTTWVEVKDSGIDDIATLVNGTAVKVSTQGEELEQTQAELATLAVTANDAYDQAYAADGRVSISDYEPTADDVAGKNDGSLWITRTRDRLNLAVNPSFETSLTGWAAGAASVARVADSPAADGSWVAEVTNNDSANAHVLASSSFEPVSPGQEISFSGYMKSVSGATGGFYAQILFYSGTTYIGPAHSGDPVTLTTSDWTRAAVSTTVPDGVDGAKWRLVSPPEHTGAVWRADAILAEFSAFIGRYFDGDSEGGSWTGTEFESASELDGNAIIRLFTLEDGGWAEKFWTADTIASVDASVIDRGEMNGGFLADNTVPIDKMYVPDVVTSQAVSAGDIVNIHNSGGVPMVRLANANVIGYDAHGFVLESAGIGEAVRVYTSGYNPLLSDLTPGTQFLSTTPGKVASAPPQEKGSFVQRVGSAVDDTTLNFAALQAVALT